MEKHSVVAVDIAKSVFDIAQSDEPGRVALRRRLSRAAFGVFSFGDSKTVFCAAKVQEPEAA